MTTVKFKEVSIKRRRTILKDGKRRQETKKFWQTISPFNTSEATGYPKTEQEIMRELEREANAWEREGW